MSDERPLRFCDVCGGLDDHPRHVRVLAKGDPNVVVAPEILDRDMAGVPVSAVQQLVNPRVAVRHMDCCAADGCSTCVRTEVANGGRRHQDLIVHLAAQREGA